MNHQSLSNLDGQAYRNFVNSLRSEATKRSYDFCLQKYMKHLHLDNVDDLLNNADKPKLIESQIIEYIVMLKNPPHSLAYQSRNLYLAAILTFYNMNDVTLNKSKISKYLGERVKAHKDRHYSIEEIEKLLHFCDDRLKAIVLLLASTGVRLGVLSQLRLSNLVVQQQYDLYQITIYENTKDEYIVFTTPEAKRAIDDYLQYRERCGEKLTPKSPLFRQQFDRTDSFGVTHPKALTDLGIITILDNALIKSGIKTIIRQTENSVYRSKLRQDVSMFNGFRKLVATNFVKAKINLVIKEMLLGHTTGLDENYYRPAENELLEEYLKVVNFLTINEENRLKIKVEELTSKTKDNEYVINHKLREKDEQLQTMEKQMQAMQNTQDELKLLLKNPRRLVEILDKEAK